MRVTVERKWPKADYTIGRCSIDGEQFCNTLELPWKDNRNGVSCIPEGTYEMTLSYSSKFNRTLPLVMGVPDRSGIRWHRGNRPADTQGCILPGENTVKGEVRNSTKYELELVRRMDIAIGNGEKIYLNIH